jgi:hypothetical protein
LGLACFELAPSEHAAVATTIQAATRAPFFDEISK